MPLYQIHVAVFLDMLPAIIPGPFVQSSWECQSTEMTLWDVLSSHLDRTAESHLGLLNIGIATAWQKQDRSGCKRTDEMATLQRAHNHDAVTEQFVYIQFCLVQCRFGVIAKRSDFLMTCISSCFFTFMCCGLTLV